MATQGTLAELRIDEDLIDALEEVYAGDGATYADRLAVVDSWAAAWEMLVDACAIARRSGDYCVADSIRDAVGRYHVGLAEGRISARYAMTIERAVAHAFR